MPLPDAGLPRTFAIDPDIRRALTPPAWFYGDPTAFAAQRERVLARAWHYVGHTGEVYEPGSVHPVTLLPGVLDEALVLTRDADGALRALSNVCTHRGNLVCTAARQGARGLACGYHGRTFGLDGRMRHMPSFEGVEGFPSRTDDLAEVALGQLGPLLFASLDPEVSFEAFAAPIRARVGHLGVERLAFDPAGSRSYEIDCHWALYCDNYLEGFHIAYVHPALHDALDEDAYRTDLFAHGSWQVGIAKPGEHAFEPPPPPGHPDAGARVAGWYGWLFPTTMVNFYPWGLSLNVVQPLGPTRTRVLYEAFVWEPTLRRQGAGGDLDRVEAEDQAVVAQVQRGVRSRIYQRGRYAPTREQGVHHFHRLLARALHPSDDAEAGAPREAARATSGSVIEEPSAPLSRAGAR